MPDTTPAPIDSVEFEVWARCHVIIGWRFGGLTMSIKSAMQPRRAATAFGAAAAYCSRLQPHLSGTNRPASGALFTHFSRRRHRD